MGGGGGGGGEGDSYPYDIHFSPKIPIPIIINYFDVLKVKTITNTRNLG